MTTRFSETSPFVTMFGLPSYRQVNRWCDLGLLGDDKQHTGSGCYRTWTDHELAKLRALQRVALDLGSLGFAGRGASAMPVVVVEELWRCLDETRTVTIRHGCVTITATLDEGEADQ